MLLSMTGFGEASRQSQRLVVTVEIRSVNSRHFKCSIRTAEGYTSLEPRVEAVVRGRIRRGTIQINLRVKPLSSSDDFRINEPVLTGYLSQLSAIAQQWDLDASAPVASILLLPGVVEEASLLPTTIEEDWSLVEEAIQEALDQLTQMRQQEGTALAGDLSAQCETIESNLQEVAQRAPLVVAGYEARLAERVAKSLEQLEVSVEPADLVREVSLFAERSDISEEIVRLRSHLQQFRTTMDLPESSGRKLEFINQEMGREVNTIGSKANDTEIAKQVVEMKTALERIREQVQNVE